MLTGCVTLEDQAAFEDLNELLKVLSADQMMPKGSRKRKLEIESQTSDEIKEEPTVEMQESTSGSEDEDKSDRKRKKIAVKPVHLCSLCAQEFSDFNETVVHLEEHVMQAMAEVPDMTLDIGLNPVPEIQPKMETEDSDHTCKFCYGIFGAEDRFLVHLDQHVQACPPNATFRCSLCCLVFNNM